jgi:hypothetical protein
MAVKIELKRSAVPGKIPTTSSLELGEVAINTYDGKLFYKQDISGTESIVEVATISGSILSASYADNAGHANTATSSSYALVATSASYAVLSTSASHALNADDAISASYALNSTTSSYALIAASSSYAEGYVTLDTNQIITGSKTFNSVLNARNIVLTTYDSSNPLDIRKINVESIGIDVTDVGLVGPGSSSNPSVNVTNLTSNSTGFRFSAGGQNQLGYGFSVENDNGSFNGYPYIYEKGTSTLFYVNSDGLIFGQKAVITNGITGSLFGTASYAINSITSSYADNFTVSGTLTAQKLVVQTISSSIIYSSGSNVFGDEFSDTQTFTGSVSITGSLLINGEDFTNTSASFDTRILNNSSSIDLLSGSYLNSSSSFDSRILSNSASIDILSSSFLSFSASYNTGSFTGSFSGSLEGTASFAATASNILGGNATYIPYFNTDTTLANSAMYQVGTGSIAINETNITTANPEALYVFQTHPTSFNVVTGKGNLNNYLQLNIQNTNQGVSASSDVVATANNGNEENMYVNMGINSENYVGPLGGGNDAYVYSVANNFHIGSAATGSQHLGFFVGGFDVDANNKLTLNVNNIHELTGSLDISNSLIVNDGITGSLFGTASNAISSSYAINADFLDGYDSAAFLLTSSYNAFTSSYLIDSASFSSSINLLSGSYLASSSSFDTRILNNSASIGTLSSSFQSFSSSYTTGSFTGSFKGDGSGLYNISASGIVGLNLSQIASGSVTASIDPNLGFRVNTNTIISGSTLISGSLTVTGSIYSSGSTILIGDLNVTNGITGSLFGTSSWANNATTSSYALVATSASHALDADNAISASHALNANNAITSSYALVATSASYALDATSASYAQTASFANDFTVAGTLTAQKLVVQTISSSVVFSSGSNTFGNDLSNTQIFTGSVNITGSLNINGSDYISTSASFDSRILANSSSISLLSGSYLNSSASFDTRILNNSSSIGALSGSYLNSSASFDTRILNNSSSINVLSSSFLAFSSSYTTGSFTGSFTGVLDGTSSYSLQSLSSSYAGFAESIADNLNITASNLYVANNIIATSISATSASFEYVQSITGSAVIIGQEYIILNTQTPSARFAGLQIYDSGSFSTASVVWDSERNHLVYQNASGSSYTGGGFMSGPRNTGSLGDEQYPSFNRILRGQGGDHLYNSNISDDDTTIKLGINTQITGSLNVSNGITGSLLGTASFADNSTSSSYALVTDYATIAGNGGVTSIIAGSGVTLPFGGTGDVTVVAAGTTTVISGSNVTQSFTNQSTWTFNHNLGIRTPIIETFDSTYNQILPENVELTDNNTVTITFPTTESGFAIASLGGVSLNSLSSSYSLFSTYASSASYFPETDPIFISKSGSLATTGSNIFKDDQTISGSLFISGATELGGDLFPKTARGATLGTLERPFREIYIQSGSINISSDTPGDPNTTLSNVSGNILVSAGGMRLLGDASFIAATGSFGYISGSMTQVGDYNQTGDYVMVGNKIITGSLTLSSGSALSINNGFYVDGNKQFNYGQFSDLTIQSASADTAYPMRLNTVDISDGVSVVSGSFIKVDNTGTYNLQFSAQVEQTSNNPADISIWLRKDGTNVPNSNTEISIEKSGKSVAAWNYMVQLNANQYVQLMWASSRSDTQLHYHTTQSTPDRPATPSVIVTLTQIA